MPRFDTLTPIHKALRALVYEVGGDLQTTDFADELEAAGAAADLELALHLMRDHHATEEVYFFPKLQPLERAAGRRDAGAARERRAAARRRGRGTRAGAGCGRRGARSRPAPTSTAASTSSSPSTSSTSPRKRPRCCRRRGEHFDDAQLMAIQGSDHRRDRSRMSCSSGSPGCSRDSTARSSSACCAAPRWACRRRRSRPSGSWAPRAWSRRPGRWCASRPGCRTAGRRRRGA